MEDRQEANMRTRRLIRKIVGWLMAFSPIITLLAVIYIRAGWMAVLKALGAFACAGLFVAVALFGVELIYSD